jgi:hypothetical protein
VRAVETFRAPAFLAKDRFLLPFSLMVVLIEWELETASLQDFAIAICSSADQPPSSKILAVHPARLVLSFWRQWHMAVDVGAGIFSYVPLCRRGGFLARKASWATQSQWSLRWPLCIHPR